FTNTHPGHAALVKALQTAAVTHVCLEATGLYHLDLAIALDDAGFQVMVVNPKVAKRFAEARSSRTKTAAVAAGL
ncbi:MAG: IS110 family transposase, partial [Candidatus Thiosymbion ectosymbiont of Robbea hypermnestra]|nr:IS110 family transposase [Candidatus Thiosymbion ectosymbiont of Robbea hypermnestra]